MIAGSNAELALRRLQQLDEAVGLGPARRWLIEAETALGEELGLECTGEPDGWNEDGSIAFYEHNGDTCPIHEWFTESDHAEAEAMAEQVAVERMRDAAARQRRLEESQS